MSEPFLAEVRIVGFNFAPRGWAFCDGQILPINQNQSLYSLLGTTYGGDGRTSFALPDMRGRVPLHVGNGHTQGQKSGEETHTLAVNEMPGHDHQLMASSSAANSAAAFGPDGAGGTTGYILARATTPEAYHDATNLAAMSSDSVTNVGGQGHENMQPFLAVNFCIALLGLFPSRN